ncbi:MAG: DUF58 domain-containing protein [Chloroflexi bacterium]|nr:DUF58 domain-containing protein [Chloroflexota bacterium]
MKSRPALIIVPLVILAVALATGSVLMLRLFSLAVLVLLLSYLWVRLGVRGISSQVKKSAERCQVGDRFGEEITVFSSSRIPKLLIKAEENTNLPGYHNVAIFNLSPKGSYCWQTEYYCQRRGQYRLGSLMVTVADPFGFFSRQRDLRQSQNIIVYPATLELPFFQPLSRNEPGPGLSRWLLSEIGTDAARVREYASGDTLNRIHWRSTSHTGKLMVKEFDADRSNAASKNVWVVLDMYQAVQAGAGDDSTEEYGVTIAASLLKKYIDSGRRVGLIASGGQPYLFPLETGSQHLSDMLEALALIKATGEVPVEQLISREIGRFTINSVVIVITPAANEQLVASLRQVRSRGAPVIIVSLDSASFGGRATGSLVSGSFQVYVIRHGEELNRALDSRRLIPQVR